MGVTAAAVIFAPPDSTRRKHRKPPYNCHADDTPGVSLMPTAPRGYGKRSHGFGHVEPLPVLPSGQRVLSLHSAAFSLAPLRLARYRLAPRRLAFR